MKAGLHPSAAGTDVRCFGIPKSCRVQEQVNKEERERWGESTAAAAEAQHLTNPDLSTKVTGEKDGSEKKWRQRERKGERLRQEDVYIQRGRERKRNSYRRGGEGQWCSYADAHCLCLLLTDFIEVEEK